MLIEFSVENFRSFKERQTLSLVASKDKAHEDSLIPCEKDNLLKAVAVFGANASGKSNLVAAIRVMEAFIRASGTRMTQGDRIRAADPFRLDAESLGEPSTFEAVVVVDGVRYIYGFSATTERVYSEWLDSDAKGRLGRLFEREFDPTTEQTTWSFNRPLKGDRTILKEKTRPNGLVLSRGAELNIEPLSKLFLWFREKLWYFGVSTPYQVLVQQTTKLMQKDEAFHARVTRLLHHADLGISGVRIDEGPIDPVKIPDMLRQVLSDDALKKFGAGRAHTIRSLHGVDGRDTPVEFDFEHAESNGTKRLFALAGPVLDALDKGALVVADELDCSMHPHLTRKLIELFQNPEVNSKGAQLVFTTHDTTLMDHTLFRRDQIWFTEKNAQGATELFSLYDFKTEDGKPRVNEAFERRYLAGRYGAVPQFGPALEDADLE